MRDAYHLRTEPKTFAPAGARNSRAKARTTFESPNPNTSCRRKPASTSCRPRQSPHKTKVFCLSVLQGEGVITTGSGGDPAAGAFNCITSTESFPDPSGAATTLGASPRARSPIAPSAASYSTS